MGKAVICIVNADPQVLKILGELKSAGFSNDDISVLMPDKSTTRDFAREHATKAPEGAISGASAGGVLGGALGWLSGLGTLAIPGMGPFIAAGPIMAALGGAAVGAAVGGIAGTLVGLGIPEIQAKKYEGQVKGGSILIAVHSEDARETSLAKTIFDRAGAQDVSTMSDASVRNEMRAQGGQGG
jgi:hypothetical protein